MVLHGERNTRFKDFYDLYVLANRFAFDGPQLASAVAATFDRRRTPITPVQSTALATGFFSNDARAAQWRTYLDRNGLPGARRLRGRHNADWLLGPVWTPSRWRDFTELGFGWTVEGEMATSRR
jgi:hypothetical protein